MRDKVIDGDKLLLVAARMGKLDAVKFLVDKGTNVNPKTKGGSTPLMEAAMWGNLDVVKYLISKGANVNASGIWAIQRGNEYLIPNGAVDKIQVK